MKERLHVQSFDMTLALIAFTNACGYSLAIATNEDGTKEAVTMVDSKTKKSLGPTLAQTLKGLSSSSEKLGGILKGLEGVPHADKLDKMFMGLMVDVTLRNKLCSIFDNNRDLLLEVVYQLQGALAEEGIRVDLSGVDADKLSDAANCVQMGNKVEGLVDTLKTRGVPENLDQETAMQNLKETILRGCKGGEKR